MKQDTIMRTIAAEYVNEVNLFGFQDSLESAPTHLFNDESFVCLLPLEIKNAPEFKKLQEKYKASGERD